MAAPFDIPFDTQLAFLWNELTGKENRTLKALRGNNELSPSGYAKQFEQLYERAGGSGMDTRMNNASNVFEQMQNEVPNLPQNVIRAYRFLTDKGLSGAQASGVVGNLMAESYPELRANAFNPEGGGQGAYGIAQWRGSRLDDLNAFAKANRPQEAGTPLTAKMNGRKPMSLLSFMQPDNSGMNLGQRLMKRDPATGLNLFGRIGRGLDAVVLPSSRMGEQIAQQGAQRAEYEKGQLDINNTIAFFEARSKEGDKLATDLLAAIRNRTIDAPTAMSMYYKEKFAKPDKTFTQMTGEQLNKERNTTSFDPKELYQVGSDGSISEVKKKPLVDLGGATDKFVTLDDELLHNTGKIGLNAATSLKRIDRLASLIGDMGGAVTSIKAFAGRFGIPTENLSDIQAAEALISSLVPLQRPEGSGPMSDADLALFKRSLPQLINTPEGNRLIIETMRGIAEYDAMGFSIIQDYRAGEIDKVTAFKRLFERPDPTAWLKTSNRTFDDEGTPETLEIPNGPTITFSNPNQ